MQVLSSRFLVVLISLFTLISSFAVGTDGRIPLLSEEIVEQSNTGEEIEELHNTYYLSLTTGIHVVSSASNALKFSGWGANQDICESSFIPDHFCPPEQ